MMWNDGMGWSGWLLMSLTAIAFWALVVVAVVALFRDSGRDSRQRPREDHDAQLILDQRFARGEIDAAEYHARQGVLRSAH
ncbi:SHOCT domain-containing protein [Knoellia locipacati]|uniref:SHOCT domain-containing protein n=1 Tax=Knoellia locipacati TaxID=882824 RepID=UPI00384E206B